MNTSFSQNPRFSTTSTTSNTSNEDGFNNKANNDSINLVESQLVVAQVHHDPIIEIKRENFVGLEKQDAQMEEKLSGTKTFWIFDMHLKIKFISTYKFIFITYTEITNHTVFQTSNLKGRLPAILLLSN